MNAFRRRPWLFPLLVFLLAGVWLLPRYLAIRALRAELAALTARLEELEAARRAPSETASPLPPAALPRLYKALVGLAEGLGLKLLALEPAEGRVNLSLEGPFDRVYGFLARVPRLAYPIWIEAYRLVPKDERAEVIGLELELGVRLETPEEAPPPE